MSQPLRKGALKDYAIRYGKVRVLLGISCEESSRRIKTHSNGKWMDLTIEKRYPLVDIKYNRRDCQQYISSLNYKVPFPSNCRFCPFLSPKELLWLYRNHPNDFKNWSNHEANKLRKFAIQQQLRGQNNHTVFGNDLTLDEVLQQAIKEFGHLSDEALSKEKFTHGHCVLSSY